MKEKVRPEIDFILDKVKKGEEVPVLQPAGSGVQDTQSVLRR